jgi:hypothetical protein
MGWVFVLFVQLHIFLPSVVGEYTPYAKTCHYTAETYTAETYANFGLGVNIQIDVGAICTDDSQCVHQDDQDPAGSWTFPGGRGSITINAVNDKCKNHDSDTRCECRLNKDVQSIPPGLSIPPYVKDWLENKLSTGVGYSDVDRGITIYRLTGDPSSTARLRPITCPWGTPTTIGGIGTPRVRVPPVPVGDPVPVYASALRDE